MKNSISVLVLVVASCAPAIVCAQISDAGKPVVLRVDAAKVTAHVSPTLYGLMTEEINYSYDGGLYAELVRNRTFQDNGENPVHWSLVQDGGGAGAIALDRTQPLNSALPVALKLDVTEPGARVGVANDGFWGIPVRADTRYRVSFYAKAVTGFTGPLTVSLESNDGATVHASAQVSDVTDQWRKFNVTLTTGEVTPSVTNRLVISAKSAGTLWLNLVSLFPPTWHDRPNGNRSDIMQLLADMKPAFLRFPGGNYLQGRTLATRFNWKQTLGDLAERPGHLNDSWNYRSSDGMGLLEFLEWCEDLNMEPVLGVFAGFTLRGVAAKPGPELEPFVQEALEEIEYVIGDTSTTWGARRAKDGHPAPFPLRCVEVGNEDNFDRVPGSYDGRYAQFFDAIKAKYPQLQVIATIDVTSRKPDVVDNHFYRNAGQMHADTHHYDHHDRSGPKIFVGEWATRMREQIPTPNLECALADAAWLTGLERNSDLVVMSCYAPLFVNVNPGGMQWRTDLIGYDALTSYGSPSYYVQQMFSRHHGDTVLAAEAENIPTQSWQPPAPRSTQQPPPPPPPPQQIPAFFFNATRDMKSGTIFLKIVNVTGAPQPVRVELTGAGNVAADGSSVTLSSAAITDTNTITDPVKIVPVTAKVSGLGASFTRTIPPYSVTILELAAR